MDSLLGEHALWLGIANSILIILLGVKTHFMTKMLFLIGEHLEWNDEHGRFRG